MTVFNYFERKEDLMLDREDLLLLLPFRKAIRMRPKGRSPIDAIRGAVDELREKKHPFARSDPRMANWWRVVGETPALKSRLRELEDAAGDGLAHELAGPRPDGAARLAAAMIVVTMRTAREEAIRVLEGQGSAKKANAAFHAVLDRGLDAVERVARKKR